MSFWDAFTLVTGIMVWVAITIAPLMLGAFVIEETSIGRPIKALIAMVMMVWIATCFAVPMSTLLP